ncbi:hypothetical protein KR054_009619 [Drosophila jambulina]|nr:hypothetical protein KR054_009619 [Drosophila jambulina]
MSERIPKVEVPRDLSMAQELRREITRNSAEISLNFWQEFENIRSTQRNRLAGESLRRERINTLMRDGQQEANKEAEALSRSISAQGMITLPMASAADPPPSPLMNAIAEGMKLLKGSETDSNTNSKTKPKGDKKPGKSSPTSTIPPKSSAASKLSVATASSRKTTPSTSKMRMSKKNKK